QRLALGQEEIAGKAVFDAYDLAHLAEFRDAFQQDYFHGCISFRQSKFGGQVRKLGGPRLRARRPRILKVASASPRIETASIGQPSTVAAAKPPARTSARLVIP